MKITMRAGFALMAGVCGLVGGCRGCGEDSDKPSYHVAEGKVSGIDLKTGAVRMLWYNEKKQREEEIEGKLAPEAEILINGRTATLDEILVGDDVKVTGRVAKRDGVPEVIATAVEVRRRESTGEPAGTRPAASGPDADTPLR